MPNSFSTRAVTGHLGLLIVATLLALPAQTVWAVRAPEAEEDPSLHPSVPLRPRAEVPGPVGVRSISFMAGELAPFLTDGDALVDEVRRYLAGEYELPEGIAVDDLELVYTSTVPEAYTQSRLRPAMRYVEFRQVLREADRVLPVQGSFVSIAVKQLRDGTTVIMKAASRLFPGVEHLLRPARPTPSDEDLLQDAAHVLQVPAEQARVAKRSTVIRWTSTDQQEGFARVVELSLDSGGQLGKDVPATWLRYVRNLDTEEAWVEPTIVYVDTDGVVSGRGVEFDPTATTDLPWLPLQDVWVRTADGASETHTNQVGTFRLQTSEGPPAVRAGLAGRWAWVTTALPPFVELAGISPWREFLFNTYAREFETADVNAYYHVTKVYHWLQGILAAGGGVEFQPIARQLRVSTNGTLHGRGCNAYYDNGGTPSLAFLRARGPCINTAYDTVIYHEYGHFFDDMAGGIVDGGLSEGIGDVLASYASGQPLIGEGFLGDDSSIRSADNSYEYPVNGSDEVHDLGQAWARFAWSLRGTLGRAEAESLVIPVVLANSRDIPDAVVDTMLLDDEDGELSNGTPHFEDIMRAAAAPLIPALSVLAARIDSPPNGAFFSPDEPIIFTGVADDRDTPFAFEYYELSYAPSLPVLEPTTWIPIGERRMVRVRDGELGRWDISRLEEGLYTVRLLAVFSGRRAEEFVQVIIGRDDLTGARQVRTIAYSQLLPDLFEDRLVWEERVAGLNPSWRLYWHDLRSGAGGPIIPGGEEVRGYEAPAIWGNRLIAEGVREDGLRDLYWITPDPETIEIAPEGPVLPETPGDRSHPDIDGTDVVYLTNAGRDVYALDLADLDAGEQLIAQRPHRLLAGDRPRIWDGKVVLAHTPHPAVDPSIYLADLRHPEQDLALLVPHGHVEGNWFIPDPARLAPDIWKHRVVWQQENPDGTSDIHLLDLRTGESRPLITAPGRQVSPRIWGNVVVWQDDRQGQWDIYRYNLLTNAEERLTSDPGGQRNPVVSPRWIAWQDHRRATAGPAVLYREIPDAFFRGDANNDGRVELTDAIFLLHALFRGGPAPDYPEAGDVDGNGATNLTDAIYLLRFLYAGGPRPPAPGPLGG